MKKTIFILLLLSLNLLQAIEKSNFQILKPKENNFISKRNTRPTETIYHEDFENGLNDWVHYDATLPRSFWHLDDFLTPEGYGYAWSMRDSLNGWYLPHIYICLETPEITVPMDGHLNFDLNWNCRFYDDCNIPNDGSFVKISNDGGENWNVISGYPDYTCDDLFIYPGFPIIPGWCGSSDGWINADFGLSMYENQDVIIRFYFLSQNYTGLPDPELYGVVIDNISIGEFDHNFNNGDEQGMTYSSIVPVGGDLWHLEEIEDAPSPTHAMICQNEEGTYNVHMLNYLESPLIHLPENCDELHADFMLRGHFEDEDNFPEVDFFGWGISIDNGENWFYMSNPYGEDLPNYVYTDIPLEWSSMIETYSLDGRIDDYAGQDVKFRIYFQTDEDEPVGEGIMIDDFKIYQTMYIGPAPDDLNAESINNESVLLTWSDPTVGDEGWIGWDTGEYGGSLGLTNGGEWAVANKFEEDDISPYLGFNITDVKIFPCEETANYTVSIWSGNNASNLLCEIPVQNPIIEELNEIELPEPILIDELTEYWIGYQIEQPNGQTYPAGYDCGPNQNGLWVNLGSWVDISGDFDFNWLIQAYVETPEGETLTLDNNHIRNSSRDLLEYNIYHSQTSDEQYELLSSIEPLEEPFYLHENPASGYNYYVVTALYDEGESEYSNEANAYILHENEEEFFHDDGTSESGYNVGATNNMVVKFSPDFDNTLTLTFLKLYVHELNTGDVIFRFWDDDGENGLPGTLFDQFFYPAVNLHSGWNLIQLPELYQLEFTNGSFYCGIFEMENLSAIGLDENGFGHSYTFVYGSWELLETGNIMLRVIGEYSTGVGEELISDFEFFLTNSPNPFSSQTTISFNISNEKKQQNEQTIIEIFNIKGQKIKALECFNSFDAQATKSLSQIVWNGTDESNKPVNSGIYFYRLKSENFASPVRKMVLMR